MGAVGVARDMAKKYAADTISQAKLYDRFSVKVRKDSGIFDAMNAAANKTGISKNNYVVQAVVRQLIADGYLSSEPEQKEDD